VDGVEMRYRGVNGAEVRRSIRFPSLVAHVPSATSIVGVTAVDRFGNELASFTLEAPDPSQVAPDGEEPSSSTPLWRHWGLWLGISGAAAATTGVLAFRARSAQTRVDELREAGEVEYVDFV